MTAALKQSATISTWCSVMAPDTLSVPDHGLTCHVPDRREDGLGVPLLEVWGVWHLRPQQEFLEAALSE